QASDGTDVSRVATVSIDVQDPALVIFSGDVASYIRVAGEDFITPAYPFAFTYGGPSGTLSGDLFGPGPLNPGESEDPSNTLTAMLAFGSLPNPDRIHNFSI